ncbi:hypothetical protein [Methylobacter sp. sgz302048]|uniref:hypothetical protein n=1 Tax=Methylobacter sp. sgz302048 TaxID=3455945 RepID=UPI003FA13E5A
MSEEKDFKDIFTSRTFWVNIVAIGGFIIQRKYGFVVDEALQAQALGVINIWLRTITKQPIVWSKTKGIPDEK